MVENIGTIHPININEEMRGSFLDYAMSVIVSRALPDARDGLKPVHRRILYAMYDMGIRANTGYKKSARIVGEVLGKYHPHGDSSVYDAMSRMVQTFSLRYPLVDGQGNFGSIDGDSPAAMRYTEARMAQLTEEMLADIDMNTVDFGDNFDSTLLEPLVLPARLPNMLLNGANGIAVGMATNIPPHNLRELSNAIAYMIENWDQLEDISVDDLMQFVTGPDFPTGATVVAGDELKEAYATGRGRVVIRAKAEVEEGRNGRPHLVITEIPYQISKTSIIERIVSLVREDRIKHIADLRDESDRQGMRLVIELKPGSQPMKVLNQLYKYTQLQSTFGIQMLALVNNEPRTLSLKRMLQIYIDHRFDGITRRSQFELEKRRARAHIVSGLMKALDSIDAIIQTIRAAEDTEGARNALMSRFELSDLQANAILEMQLRRLAALERQKLLDEYNELMARIAYLEDLLASPYKILGLIRDDVVQLATDYGDERRTGIAYGVRTEFEEADLVRDEEVVILLTKHGYIKRVPTSAYTTQHRGGKGVTGMVTREEDGVVQLVAANSLDTIMFFTNRGKVYSERCYVVPEGARAAKGTLVHIFLGLESDEQITAIVPTADFDDGYFVLATKLGRIKRVRKSEFEDVRATGKIAIALDEGDTLNWVRPSNGEQNVILATVDGQSIRFDEDRVRVLGRQAAGVNSMRLSEGDTITGMDVIEEGDTHVLVVTANGYGKRTSIEEYRVQGRYGSGIRTLSRNEKTGPIIAMNCINPKDDILLITSSNQILRTRLGDIRDTGRSAMGVRLVDLGKRNKIVGMAILDGLPIEDDDGEDGGEIGDLGDIGEEGFDAVNGNGAEPPLMNGSHDVDDDEDEGEE